MRKIIPISFLLALVTITPTRAETVTINVCYDIATTRTTNSLNDTLGGIFYNEESVDDMTVWKLNKPEWAGGNDNYYECNPYTDNYKNCNPAKKTFKCNHTDNQYKDCGAPSGDIIAEQFSTIHKSLQDIKVNGEKVNVVSNINPGYTSIYWDVYDASASGSDTGFLTEWKIPTYPRITCLSTPSSFDPGDQQVYNNNCRGKILPIKEGESIRELLNLKQPSDLMTVEKCEQNCNDWWDDDDSQKDECKKNCKGICTLILMPVYTTEGTQSIGCNDRNWDSSKTCNDVYQNANCPTGYYCPGMEGNDEEKNPNGVAKKCPYGTSPIGSTDKSACTMSGNRPIVLIDEEGTKEVTFNWN